MRTIKIGLLGLGTVGGGVVKLLQEHAAKIEQTTNVHFILKRVAVAHLNKPRKFSLPEETILTDQIDEVLNDPEIQIIVETMGTINRARQAIVQAIYNHKSVITANKDLLAIDGPKLAQLAKSRHVDFLYEASVAGGIPILRVLSSSLVTDQITRVSGIINGTANYILSAMVSDNLSYDKALMNAQQKGYAEANPVNDVKGIDAANKLSILSQFAFGKALDPTNLNVRGIDQLTSAQLASAKQFGYTIKLLAIAKRLSNRLYTSVGPTLVDNNDQLAQVNGVQNAIAIESNALGSSVYTGPGAGAKPTANSILSDLAAAANDILNYDCGNAFNNYHSELTPSTLNNAPQSYLITIYGRSTRPVDSIDWQNETSNHNYWSGLTPVISHKKLNLLLETIGNDFAVSYLPVYGTVKLQAIKEVK
ncbi:homoserine dehydrogenase [Limosilactobacillus fastidiosus]|nr:homoserine dehydrogenase [Limosilactobacillus fastidiosus]MBB1085632.1 homoserine dehydrogenase [Limosilactobacillus fastidiosus]MCD7086085.1 homoserine dehydrogenase [Limosilactobacillus fastidiosus]MCD7114271.1 homoserine dehydrogenase [Limosilactobacillus fastidiosus]MCD7116278.1 homoserine dehydrogenase [Limosilactobacillus fastidiosus]